MQFEFDWTTGDDDGPGEYLELGDGAMIGEGGIPGVTSVANSGTGIPKGTGGNIPSANSRRKKKRMAVGVGPASGDLATKAGLGEGN